MLGETTHNAMIMNRSYFDLPGEVNIGKASKVLFGRIRKPKPKRPSGSYQDSECSKRLQYI